MSAVAPRPGRDRGKWSEPGVPHKGWSCVGFEDLEDLIGICEMCETQSIRYVHHMEHPDYPDVLGVGRVCAEHMEEDYVGARQREKQAVSLASRRSRWMNTEWRRSKRGNHYINRNGFNIVLYERFDGWAYRIRQRDSERSWYGARYATLDEAKLAAFECFVAL